MNNLKEYIIEKLKLNKDIDINNNVYKYFLDLDFYDPAEDKCFGDMEYSTSQINEMWWDDPEELIAGLEEHIDDDIEQFGDSDDYSIPIYSIQERQYDTKKFLDSGDDIEKYHWGDDYLKTEIGSKRKIIASFISKEYLDKTEDEWIQHRDLSRRNILKEINKNFGGPINWL